MKNNLILFILLLTSPFVASAQFTIPQGGTGTTTFPTNWVVLGNSALRLTAMATSSLGLESPLTFSTGLNRIGNTVTNTGVTSVIAGTGINVSGATGAVTISATGSGGSGTISTSSPLVSGQGVYATGVSTIASIATSTPSAGGPITYSGTFGNLFGGISGTFGCTAASGSVNGCLSSTDWTTFNNKGSGTVTSVAASVPSIFSISGSPITTSGTLAMTYSGTALPIANGGTATTTQVTNAVNYFDGTRITGNPSLLSFTGTNFGIATSSPYSILSAVGTTTIYGKYAHFGSVVCNASLYNIGDGFEFCGSSNADTQGSQIQVSNNNAGTAAFAGFTLNNNESDTSFLHFAGLYLNSSTYTSTGFGTAFANKRQALLQNTDGLLSLISSTSSTALNDAGINFITGGTATANERMRITTLGDVGIGTTTPAGTLGITTRSTDTYGMVLADRYNTPVVQVQTASTTGPIFQIQATSTADTLFQVDQYGHLMASSTRAKPTVSCTPSGGTISANSNDVTGDITTGTLSTACTVTFGAAYSATPEIFLQQSGVASILGISARSTTAFTISLGTAATGDSISYFVVTP